MTDEAVTIEQVVGQRMKERREALGMTQAQLGEKLGEWLERSWPRQAVYEAERGQRGFRAVELVALESVLETSIGWLTTPDPGRIRFPSGVVVMDVSSRGSEPPSTALYEAVLEELSQLRAHFERIDPLIKAMEQAVTQDEEREDS